MWSFTTVPAQGAAIVIALPSRLHVTVEDVFACLVGRQLLGNAALGFGKSGAARGNFIGQPRQGVFRVGALGTQRFDLAFELVHFELRPVGVEPADHAGLELTLLARRHLLQERPLLLLDLGLSVERGQPLLEAPLLLLVGPLLVVEA